MQPRDPSASRYSPDGFWWWDGVRWVPVRQVPVSPPSSPPYFQMPPPLEIKPSPGLRPFLIVMLAIDAVLFGVLSIFGTIGEVSDLSEGQGQTGGIVVLLVFVVVFATAVSALLGVVVRAPWARWASVAAGIAVTLTCLGSVVGIPILVAAARAPLRRSAAVTSP